MGSSLLVSAELLQSQSETGMPQEQLFQREGGIKLGSETIKSEKFLEQKILPVNYWNPPNKDVEELYFKQKALQDFNGELFEARGFTDTDIVMMNRWQGLENYHNLWEADMILSSKQRAMHTKQGKIFGNTDSLMQNFSHPWPNAEVQYFFENEGSDDFFGDLQMAMSVWEHAVGCIKFKLVNVESISNATTARTLQDNLEYADLTEITPGLEQVTSAPSNFSDSHGDIGSEPLPKDLSGTSHLLRVTAGDGCYASVGWQLWSSIVISERCSLGVLVHLLGHVLGLPHEHSRPDRVLHVDLQTQNVRTRDFLFLNTAELGGARCSDAPLGWYDVRSVMHLDPYGLSANNLSSLTARRFPDTGLMGASWRRPSYTDVLRLRSAYQCAQQASEGCSEAPSCVGTLGPDCSCSPPEGCSAHPRPGACGGELQLPQPEAPPQQLTVPAVRRRGRVCAWRLRAASACGRARLTLRLRMEEGARVAATALGCAPLRVETLDEDPMAGGRNVSSVVCLSDFTRWRPEGASSWVATKQVVSAGPQLRVIIKQYPVADPELARVLKSFEVRLESMVDKYCHCNLAG